jgi:hypothetical protein
MTDDNIVQSIAEASYGLYPSQATLGHPEPMMPPLAPSARLVAGVLELTVYTSQYGPVTFDMSLSAAMLLQSELAKAINSKYCELLREGMGDLLDE